MYTLSGDGISCIPCKILSAFKSLFPASKYISPSKLCVLSIDFVIIYTSCVCFIIGDMFLGIAFIHKKTLYTCLLLIDVYAMLPS